MVQTFKLLSKLLKDNDFQTELVGLGAAAGLSHNVICSRLSGASKVDIVVQSKRAELVEHL
eukprot:2777971-Amphidinium_carterae.1